MKKIIISILAIVFMCSLVSCVSTPSNFKVDFKESKVVTIDFSNGTENMLLLFFDCSNETEHNITPMSGADIKAFQNGIALDFCTLYDLEEMGDAIPCDTEMQSGANATVVWFFELKDNSDVSIDVNGESFTVEVEIEDKSGEATPTDELERGDEVSITGQCTGDSLVNGNTLWVQVQRSDETFVIYYCQLKDEFLADGEKLKTLDVVKIKGHFLDLIDLDTENAAPVVALYDCEIIS